MFKLNSSKRNKVGVRVFHDYYVINCFVNLYACFSLYMNFIALLFWRLDTPACSMHV